MTRLLTEDEAFALHDAAIKAFGGTPGLRDRALLDSALAQPLMTFDGVELYPTLFDKVSAIAFSLISNHAFVDGNKRVGFAAMGVILLRNGFRLDCTADEGERITLNVAAGQATREELTMWIRQHAVEA